MGNIRKYTSGSVVNERVAAELLHTASRVAEYCIESSVSMDIHRHSNRRLFFWPYTGIVLYGPGRLRNLNR